MKEQFDLNIPSVSSKTSTSEKVTIDIDNVDPPFQLPEVKTELDEIYSAEEIEDPNNIVVNIEPGYPIVILFGARTSGKTMVLIRLTRFLESKGYKVEPYRIFRGSQDRNYRRMCDNFRNLCYDQYAASGTHTMNFMLLKILDKTGRPICQILEAPGEHFFDVDKPNAQFPTYLLQIIQNTSLRRVWCFLVQKDWEEKDPSSRIKYSNKVREIQRTDMDSAIFVCTQVDKYKNAIVNGIPNVQQFYIDIQNTYDNGSIFENWRNTNPITKIFKPNLFQFVPFSSGAFSNTESGRQVYIPGNDIYPALLWKSILKSIRG